MFIYLVLCSFIFMFTDSLSDLTTFTNYHRKRKLHVIQKRQRFGPFAEQLTIVSARCLSECYLVLTCCSNPDSAKRNGRSIDELICSYILTESKVSKLCGCLKYIFQRVGLRKENEIPLFRNWFPSVIWHMICIRKFSIFCHSQYEIYIEFAEKVTVDLVRTDYKVFNN